MPCQPCDVQLILRVANLILIDLDVKHLGFRTMNNLSICHA
ncbi:hypothetical protein GCM10010301_73620 [Streptomyces plicatus]|nr:hypothetical protein GCM10010301_73620 [Streptomyces plicatus]